MKPRWYTALMLLTMPVWFLPACAVVGFVEAGRNTLREIPAALRWVFLGKRP